MNEKNEQATTDPVDNGSAVVDADELQRQRDDFYDRLLRKTAEFDNYRKRVERDRQSMADAVTTDVVRDLLPLVDDLERALKLAPGPTPALTVRRPIAAASSSSIASCWRSCASAASQPSKRWEPTSTRMCIRQSPMSLLRASATARSSKSSGAATC